MGKHVSASRAACVDCSETEVAREGSEACESCSNGTIPNAEQSKCSTCDPGKHRSASKAGCDACPPNEVRAALHSSAPVLRYRSVFFLTRSLRPTAQVAIEGSEECTRCNAEDGQIENAAHSKCFTCTDGSYGSPTTNTSTGGLTRQAECIQCPSSGFACVGGKIKIESGTWYSVSNNPKIAADIEIHACFNADACVYPDDDDADKAAVACNTDNGYGGPLCGVCDRATSFTRVGAACAKCIPTLWTWLAIAAVALGLFAFIVHLTAFRSTTHHIGEYGGIIRRIAFSYIQVRLSHACTRAPSHARSLSNARRVLRLPMNECHRSQRRPPPHRRALRHARARRFPPSRWSAC